jgi:GMP synthase (glutamine-hydrolysing)
MRTALAITHVAFEDLGSLGDVLTKAGFLVETIDACTANLETIDACAPDLLIVLGGPIGVYDADAYPFIQSEIKLLKTRLAAKLPTLGICLGAQLMAAALNAKVYPGAHGKELGWTPIRAGSASSPSWFASLLAAELHVLHWHGDTFDLPAAAVHLAGTSCYPNQAFMLGSHALALQFHPEVTVQGLECWYVGHACELSSAGIDVSRLREDSHRFGPDLEHAAHGFWEQWLDYALPDTGKR